MERPSTFTPAGTTKGETLLIISADGALSAAIQAEQNFEAEEASGLPDVPEFIEHFNQQGVWDLKDIPGAEDVVLTRKFGNETCVPSLHISQRSTASWDPLSVLSVPSVLSVLAAPVFLDGPLLGADVQP